MNEVPHTIYRQLGAGRLVAMTGAKNFLGDDESLSFRLPTGLSKDRINYVKVTLTPMDLYDVEFKTIRGNTVKDVKNVEGIYFDQLLPVFREATGLSTSL